MRNAIIAERLIVLKGHIVHQLSLYQKIHLIIIIIMYYAVVSGNGV